MTSWGGNSYVYDPGNSMVKQNGRWYFLYTFSGERIATIDWQGSIAVRCSNLGASRGEWRMGAKLRAQARGCGEPYVVEHGNHKHG